MHRKGPQVGRRDGSGIGDKHCGILKKTCCAGGDFFGFEQEDML
jgi:hypothetical protein